MALVLVDMHGVSVAEAAQILEVAEGTVKSRCFRGREALAALLRVPAGTTEAAGASEPLGRAPASTAAPNSNATVTGPVTTTTRGEDR